MGCDQSRVRDVSEDKGEFSGPIKKRSCTDVICLLLLLVFVGGWLATGVYAFANGNPDRLVYPSNSKGEICGRGEFKTKPLLLYFDMSRCIRPDVIFSGCPTPKVCVEECPSTFGTPYEDGGDPTEVKKEMFPFCGPEMTESMITDSSVSPSSLIQSGTCPPWWVPSTPLLKRCIPFFAKDSNDDDLKDETVIVERAATPTNEEVTAKSLKDAVHNVATFLELRTLGERIFADLAQTWWVLLVLLCLSTLLAFSWIVLMRWVAEIMVWASIVISLALLTACCVYSFFKYQELKDVPDAQNSWFDEGFTSDWNVYANLSTTWLVIFIALIVIIVVLVLVIFFLRKRIKLAIELIEEASYAVGAIKSSLFFPLIPFAFELLVIAWFTAVALFLASSGRQQYMVNTEECPNAKEQSESSLECVMVDNNVAVPDSLDCPAGTTCEFFKYGNPTKANYLQLYNLFGLLWLLFFSSAVEEMVMAGAFAHWYFTRDKDKLTATPISASAGRTFRYHLGTLAFGSLIISVIRMIRIMIEYVQRKLEEYGEDNVVVKAVVCCCRCCFWCLEQFMRFVNRNAYIMCAIYGENFCASAKEAFSLLMRNAARVLVLDSITDFLLFLGKVVVVGAMAILSFFIFSGRIGYVDLGDLNYYFIPVILITLGSFFIADAFFEVYEMAVDTIFLCFLEDIERNDGSAEKPYFMSRDLKKVLGYLENDDDDDEDEDEDRERKED